MRDDCCAREIMNPEVITVRDDLSCQDLARFLIEMEITGVPVLDADEQLVGVVSSTDIVRASATGMDVQPEESVPAYYLHSEEAHLCREELRQLHVEDKGTLVRDIMTPIIYTVSSETHASEIASTMIRSRIHRVIVLEDDQIVGIITSLDLLKLIAT